MQSSVVAACAALGAQEMQRQLRETDSQRFTVISEEGFGEMIICNQFNENWWRNFIDMAIFFISQWLFMAPGRPNLLTFSRD